LLRSNKRELDQVQDRKGAIEKKEFNEALSRRKGSPVCEEGGHLLATLADARPSSEEPGEKLGEVLKTAKGDSGEKKGVLLTR